MAQGKGWSPACASALAVPSCSSRIEQGRQLRQEPRVWEMGTTHREGRRLSPSQPPVLGCCDGDQMLTQTLPAGI